MSTFRSVEDVRAALDTVDYLADDGLATAVFLATTLGRPLLLEGEPGVGKTSAATSLARALGTRFLRLQCYEGLGVGEALYEWNYQRQLLATRLADTGVVVSDVFSEEFLVERPILAAVRDAGPVPPVLLVDEIDRADDEFEAMLLEFLGESAVTVPELGTYTATRPPLVVLTSNRSRELHDALRRRCLYHWIDFPSAERAVTILRRAVPSASEALLGDVASFVVDLRTLDLDKPPGLAEAIDWVAALGALGVTALVRDDIVRTLSALTKTPDDRVVVEESLVALGHP